MALPEDERDRLQGSYRDTAGGPAFAVVKSDGTDMAGGGTSMPDDSAFTAGASSVTPAGFLADDTATDAVDEGDIGAARMNPTTRIIYVQLKDTNGDDVAVGGGTQYTEGDTDASITGTAMLWEDTSDTLRAVSASKPLPVAQTGALPAGTNAIGKLAANSGVDIGDVDVTSLPSIPAGNNNIGDVDIASIAAGDNNIGNVDVVTLPSIPAGTNNIGDVDVLSLPALPAGNNNIGDVDVATIAAGTNVIGKVIGTDSTGTIYDGTTARTPLFAAVAAASSGNNTIATNTNGGLKIRVLAMAVVATSAVSLYFTSDSGGSVIFGGSTNKIALAANGGFVLPYNPAGWFETAANHDVVMNLSGAVAVSGGLTYIEVS